MSVRRLAAAEVQPTSFAFTPDNEAWAASVIAKFPVGKQASAVIPFLMRAQEQEGWVSKAAIETIADRLGMKHIRVLEVATFYTQFQLAPVGSVAHVQVCGTTPCMLRGSDEIIKICKSRIAHHAHELSSDGKFSWEEVECLGACVNAPMVAVASDTYEDLTADSFNAVLDAFARGETPKPGPQIGRVGAEAEGGQTTLLDPKLYDGSGAYRVHLLMAEPAPAQPLAPVDVGKPDPKPEPGPVTPPANPPSVKGAIESAVEQGADVKPTNG